MAARTKLQFVDPSVSFPTIDPSNQIRLLLLSLSREQSIVCRFNVVSLKEPPPYEALSYVWGRSDDPQVITVDDHPFGVTQNLYKALHNLVLPDGAVRVLWIDAICINQGAEQSDLSERSQQVQLMGQIFAGATSVIAYLGELYPGLLEAMKFLTAVSRGRQWHVDWLTQSKYRNPAQLVSALTAFVNYPWWSRIWTVQEAVVAAKPRFQFGKFEIGFHVVHQAFYNIVLEEILVPPELLFDIRISTRYAELFRLLSSRTRFSLLDTLGAFQHRDSGDPRDKVYSLMGLVSDIDQIIKIDYTIPTEQLFQDVTLACIQKYQNLKVLGHLFDPANRVHRNMPSFVVDWSYQPSSLSINILVKRNQVHNEVFRACKDSKAIWHLAQAGRVRANGFIFDSIDTVMGERILERDSWYPATAIANAIQAIVETANDRGSKGQEETLADIRHTLWMDCKRRKQDGKTENILVRLQGEDDELLLNTYWEAFLNPSNPAGADGLSRELEWVESTLVDAAWGRSFIFTEGGRMGLAPDWCKPGDAIAIMGGGIVPIVLRPLAEGANPGSKTPVFEVVGEAYVHGVMDGQALDANGRTDGNLDDIYLV